MVVAERKGRLPHLLARVAVKTNAKTFSTWPALSAWLSSFSIRLRLLSSSGPAEPTKHIRAQHVTKRWHDRNYFKTGSYWLFWLVSDQQEQVNIITKLNTFLRIFHMFLKETKSKYTREHMAAGLVWERLNWLKEMPLSHSKASQVFAAHFLLRKWMMWPHIKQKLHDQISGQKYYLILHTTSINMK